MLLKGKYKDKSAFFQLLVLLSLMVVGAVISSTVGLVPFFLTYGFEADMFEYPNVLRIIQFLSAIGTFLLPALGAAWLCSDKPSEYLSANKYPSAKAFTLTGLSVMLLSPSITLMGAINKAMKLPEFMKPIEIWMQSQEDAAERMTEILLSENTLPILLFNLLVIAIAAGVTEEFLFRGTLQRIFEKWSNNQHTVIWSAAILFSAIHMQFYGFIPRLLLGAYFGYLLFWSKSIWIPVFAHFVNNALAVIAMSSNGLKNNELISGEIPSEDRLVFAFVVAISLVFLIMTIGRLRKHFLT